jgi:ABC-type multidrug transport system fused ATPase/permease subunit
MVKQHIDLNSIVWTSLKSNKFLMTCIIISFMGFISYNIVFPKMFTGLLEKDSISRNDIFKTAVPFMLGQGLFCLSDKIYSRGIHIFNNNLVHDILHNLLKCYENSYQERDPIVIYSNLIKLSTIKNIIHIFIEYLIPLISITLGTFVYLCMKDIKLGFMLMGIIGLSIILILVGLNNRRSSSGDKSYETVYKKEINDIVFNIDKIIINNNIDGELHHFKDFEDKNLQDNIDKEDVNLNIKYIIAFMSVSILLVVGSQIVKMYNDKLLDKGEFVYYFYLVIILLQYYDSLSIELNNLLNHIHEYRELCDYFKGIQCEEKSDLPDISLTNGDIKFTEVDISYGDKQVFTDLNIEFRGNNKTAVLGRNGIGKSTIFKVLLGLLPYKGTITVDGSDLSTHNIASFRRNIGFVNQSSMLFNRSIYENLQYGNGKTRKQIDKYIVDNGLQEFIRGLGPDGLDTVISKNGESISGGQRCIVNIIKCILDDKKILLIDEPSNNLDAGMKEFLVNIIKGLQGKTVIIITHDDHLNGVFDNTISIGPPEAGIYH